MGKRNKERVDVLSWEAVYFGATYCQQYLYLKMDSMKAMNSARFFEEEVLPLLEKPSRYLGNELNSVHKDTAQVRLRIALAFPDLYDLGLGNLGIQILYHILNQQADIWAERVYAPAVDAEAHMRKRGIPLLSLESRTPLYQFDAVGFTLQSELTYTNILNMLDMGKVPILTAERTDDDPIILAGGPCVFNPEPLVDFIDAFVIGDGEEAILEIAEILRHTQKTSRAERLGQLADLEGVYVPAHYPMFIPLSDGTLVPPPDAPRIVKRNVSDLNQIPFPTDYIVPFTKQIHDRISLEVLRGCTQGCRFCQAGMVTRPVRERDLDNLDQLMQETLDRTGYEEVSLISLSTCDYSRVKSLLQRSVSRAVPQRIGVSLPSLRLDSFSVELADMVSVFKKSGVTFAPEAATDRLRSVINKFIPDEELLRMTEECYRRGWQMIKLYFMMGLPMEQDEDILAIAGLVDRVLRAGRRANPRARLRLSVSTFVPKSHTPFQWDEQMSIGETDRKQELLSRHLPRRAQWSRHDARESFIEGIVARGDRRVGSLLYEAFRLGCKFDAWREHLNWTAWQEAMDRWNDATGVQPEKMLRARALDEPLPWDHIDILVSKEWLKAEHGLSRSSIWHGDCRHVKCSQCGVIKRRKNECLTMLRRSHTDSKKDTEVQRELPQYDEPPPVQRLRFRYAKLGSMRYLSGLEEKNVLQRALQRAKVAMSYSQGFEPQPRLSFMGSLSTGYESKAEYADLLLRERLEPAVFQARLNTALPDGFEMLGVWAIPLREKSLSAQFTGATYELWIPRKHMQEGISDFPERIAHYLSVDQIKLDRRRKRGKVWKRVNIRPAIEQFEFIEETEQHVLLRMRLRERGEVTTKVREVIQTFFDAEDPVIPYIRVCRTTSLGIPEPDSDSRHLFC